MAVDENGYICTLKKQPIPARYQELLTSVQSQLLAQYGDRICSIFIYIADKTSIEQVYQYCAFLPLLGIFTVLLPNLEQK